MTGPMFFRIIEITFASYMVPALLLPPRWFYGGRQWLGAQKWYKRARAGAVPVPGFAMVEIPKTDTPETAASSDAKN